MMKYIEAEYSELQLLGESFWASIHCCGKAPVQIASCLIGIP